MKIRQSTHNLLNSNNPILEFFNHDISPSDIKEMIIHTFEPYFDDRELLVELSPDKLISQWILFMGFKNQVVLKKGFEELIQIGKLAVTSDKISSIKSYPLYINEITSSHKKYWSFVHLENSKSDLELEDFAAEILNSIGQMIEVNIKTYLQFNIHLLKIKKGRIPNKNLITQQKLGNLLNELNDSLSSNDFLKIKGVKLNQWRNIAYHHNYEVKDGFIECYYKISGIDHQIRLTREELLNTAIQVKHTLSIFRLTETFFVFNNLKAIQEEFEKQGITQLALRDEAKLLDFYTGLSGQGFQVEDIRIDKNISILTLRDLISNQVTKDLKRIIHSSQQLYNFWILTDADKVVIKYLLKDGRSPCYSTVDKVTCSKIASKEVEFHYLAQKVEYVWNDDFQNSSHKSLVV